jgi:hypothetical protein
MVGYFRVLFFASLLVALLFCLVGLGPEAWCAVVLGLVAGSASTHSYKHEPIPVYPMGGDFVPYPYPWVQFLSHTRTLIGEFPTG